MTNAGLPTWKRWPREDFPARRDPVVEPRFRFVKFPRVLMPKPLSSRALLSLFLVVPLLGCTAKPPERPIVLRPHHSERRLARRPPTPVAQAEAPATTLSPDEKENLFRAFESYLSKNGKPQ